ncbi:unnamed protein product [Ceutorhynchus assimilis]|uniref:Vacuolar ATPase assembly integral membrane protein VMA21 homolog n=1 Tax=Ceutorhynchus assimilis TaxID=467358 RepID=A0A9N9MGC7_9CUCU|nr:unnamed protein product [Ceutorhynchus assimilis]
MDQNEQPQLSVFKTVLSYSLFILVSPVLTFFVFKFIFFEGIVGTNSTSSNVWSAVFAIIVLHIALGMYIMRAYSEADKPTRTKPIDKVD